MRRVLLALLCLLFAAISANAQVAALDFEIATDTTTDSAGPLTESSYPMPGTTNGLLVFLGGQGNMTNVTMVWNGSESLTLVGLADGSGTSDTDVRAYCRLSPTITTANLVADWDGPIDGVWMVAIPMSGVDQTSCAASMVELDDDVDDAAASASIVFPSAGSAGNRGYVAVSAVSDNATFTNNASFTESVESQTGGGQNSNTEDFSFYVADGNLPAAVTVTISETDEHAAVYMSVAAAATSTIRPLAAQYLQEHSRP